MEKKYLEISLNGKVIGAFENVSNFFEVNGNQMRFDSDDGSFVYNRNADGIWESDACQYTFDSYQYEGRRTLLRHNEKIYQEQLREHLRQQAAQRRQAF